MKTRSEKRFADLIIAAIIHSNQNAKEKERQMKKFFSEHSYCYENLCYNIYYLSSMSGTNVLTVDETGGSYINLKDRDPNRDYFDVLVLNEYSPCCSDIITHIDVALDHLYEMVHGRCEALH